MLVNKQDPDEWYFQYQIIPNGTEVLIAKVNSKPPSTSGRQPYEFVKISPRYLKDEYPAPVWRKSSNLNSKTNRPQFHLQELPEDRYRDLKSFHPISDR